MPSSKELFKNLKINKDLVVEFFIYFSRFEYALKRAEYIRGNSKGAEAYWDKFVDEIKEAFDAKINTELEEAVKYLLSNPPKKQVLYEGRLSWKDNRRNKGESNIKYLLRLVRTVRNNLFHGSKFREVFDGQARDERLIKSSLVLLKTCLELKKDLNNYFFEGV